MSKLLHVARAAALFALFSALLSGRAAAQDKVKEAETKYGLDVRVRKFNEGDFSETTAKVGIEVFRDDNSGKLLYITERGQIAAAPGEVGKVVKPKPGVWKHAMNLGVRKAGEATFSKDTTKYGIEVYRDENSGNLVYICETGSIAVVPGGPAAGADKAKAPEWKHGMAVKVRKAGEKFFNKDTNKIGIEVFRDENNGNLIYISEKGSIAVAAGVTTQGGKEPEWKHGFELSVRKAGDKDFNKDTKRYGIEVFRDENNGNAIYIAETGDLAVMPGVKLAATDKVKPPEWKYANDLAARKAGEEKFTKDTKKYGVEVFRDENDGLLVAISQTGSLAVMTAK